MNHKEHKAKSHTKKYKTSNLKLETLNPCLPAGRLEPLNTSKTIFITTPWFYPAYKAGGPVQSIANMVQELAEGYNFYIYTSDSDLGGEALKGVKTGQWVRYNAYTQVWYAPKANRSNILLKQLSLMNPDVLYMVGIYSWYFTQVPLYFSKGPAKLLSVRGMLHPGALSEKKWKKQLYLQAARWLKICNRTAFHATDGTESAYISAALGSQARQFEAGNFPRQLPVCSLPGKIAGELELVSVALVSPMKNILEVLQALKRCSSRVHYSVYGPIKDPLYMNDCRDAVRELPHHVTVKFHGELSPHFVAEVLGKAQVFILPSRSENFGHAIYEALSAGLPVITSQHTPWNGLQAAGAGINVGDDAAALTAAIEYFAQMDSGVFANFPQATQAYIAGKLDKTTIRAQYDAMFDGVLKQEHA